MNTYDINDYNSVITTSATITTGTPVWSSTDASYDPTISFTPNYHYVVRNPSPEEVKNLLEIILKCISHNISFDIIEKEIDKVEFSSISNVISGLEKLIETRGRKSISFDELENDIIKEIEAPTLQRNVNVVNL